MSIGQHRRILLEALIGKDSYTYCKERVGEDEADVFKGILKKDVEEWFASKDVSFRREGRATIEFVEALVLDKVVLYWLKDYFDKENGLKLVLNGCDKIDTLLNNHVTYDPDFKIEEKEIYIEEITCYTGMVRTTGALHLRKSKGDTLKRLAKDKEVYILIFDVPTRSYTFVEIKEDTTMYGIDEIGKFGGESGYGMDVGHAKFREIKQTNLPIQEIIEQLIGLKNDESLIEKVRQICEDALMGIHSVECIEKFIGKDGIHYIYSRDKEYPIIKIKIENGVITKAWDESKEY